MGNEKQAAVHDPLIGQVFGGRYTMRRLIGRGGVGLVYLAENNETGDDVVLKLLSPDWSRNPEAVRRFEREAERLGGVRHPNIVRLLDRGHDAGRAYLVMEYLDGVLLSDFIQDRGQLDLRTFVPIAAQVLKGVGHAHSRGVMIRDIKPANIMLCERKGRANFVKILDFGLAKLIRDEQPVTEEHVLGTAGYLAPEVIQGAEEVDLRADVFSLGTLFYLMLSGRIPFEGDENATVFYKTIHDEPTPLADVLPSTHEVPDGLVALVHQCLAKNPAMRPDDANVIVEQLIDVVPASMFRLPRLAVPGPGSSQHSTGEFLPPGYGNTGMMRLVGTQALSGQYPAVPTARPSEHDQAEEAQPVQLQHPVGAPHGDRHEAAAPPRRRGPLLVVAGVAGLVALGSIAVLVDNSDEPGAKLASLTPQQSVDATIAQVQAHVAAGDLEAAESKLDELRTMTGQHPSLARRVARLGSTLAAAKLVDTGQKLEANGQRDAAIVAYRDALAAEPSHVAARQRISELQASDHSGLVPVDIDARPAANVFIDGTPHGTTPFEGSLPVGSHEIRLEAHGYQTWTRTLDVEPEGADDISVRLVGKGRSKQPQRTPAKRPRSNEPRLGASVPASPTRAEQSKTGHPSTARDDVFLSTKEDARENGGGVFLPTKE